MNRMKPFKALITFEEAKRRILENTPKVERTEFVDLREAHGRVLASTLKANLDIPGFRRAAMDGYAVRAEDTYGAARLTPKRLNAIGSVFTGQISDAEVKEQQCIQIATGAPMPDGADAVVMVEETSSSGTEIDIFKPVYPGANVSSANADMAKGDEVLQIGSLLTPARVGVLAALGLTRVEVFARPKVAIFPTGEEIIEPGNEIEFGKVYDINSYTLASLLESSGAEVEIRPIAGDSMDDLRKCIHLASERGSDYAIFSGGSSVGERDLLVDVLRELGDVLFHGIALKPGKPTLFGKVGGTLVFGMPGYPTSCLTNAYVLLLPSIRRMAGLPSNTRTEEHILTQRLVSTIGRHQLYPVRIEDGKAIPAFKESGAITSMSRATGWIEIPHNTEFVEEGTTVTVHYF